MFRVPQGRSRIPVQLWSVDYLYLPSSFTRRPASFNLLHTSILKKICNWYSRNEKETGIDIGTYQMEIIKENGRVSFHFPGKTKMAKHHFRCEHFDPLLRVTLASNFCVSVSFSFRRTKQRGEESE